MTLYYIVSYLSFDNTSFTYLKIIWMSDLKINKYTENNYPFKNYLRKLSSLPCD